MTLLSRRAALLGLAGGLALPRLTLAADTALRVNVEFHAPMTAAEEKGLHGWLAAVQPMMARWWPVMTRVLASPGYRPTDQVTLAFFVIEPAAVAAVTFGARIAINQPNLLAHLHNPDMYGLVAHELTHVAQAYPARRTAWVTEGIADYLRYYVLMPGDPARGFDGRTMNWKLGYQPAAGLIDWVERTRPGTLARLNAALRAGKEGTAAFTRAAGGDPKTLWRAYLASHPPAATPAAERARELDQARG